MASTSWKTLTQACHENLWLGFLVVVSLLFEDGLQVYDVKTITLPMPWRWCCLAWPLGNREHKQVNTSKWTQVNTSSMASWKAWNKQLLHQNLRALASPRLQQTQTANNQSYVPLVPLHHHIVHRTLPSKKQSRAVRAREVPQGCSTMLMLPPAMTDPPDWWFLTIGQFHYILAHRYAIFVGQFHYIPPSLICIWRRTWSKWFAVYYQCQCPCSTVTVIAFCQSLSSRSQWFLSCIWCPRRNLFDMRVLCACGFRETKAFCHSVFMIVFVFVLNSIRQLSYREMCVHCA